MANVFALHTHERRVLFTYLLLATGLLAGTAGWVLYRVYDSPAINAEYLTAKIKRQDRLFDQQKHYLPMLDSAHHAVTTYRPQVTAVFLEADVQNQISDLHQLYTANDTVLFFRAFDQAANFYQMLYRDKKILASKQFNAHLFAKQLEACAIGFQATAPAGTASPTVAPPAPLPLAR